MAWVHGQCMGIAVHWQCMGIAVHWQCMVCYWYARREGRVVGYR